MTRSFVLATAAGCGLIVGMLTLSGCREAADPNQIRLNGRIEAAMVDLSPKVTGRVREVLVKEGDHVKAGDVLVRLDLGETGLTVARDKSTVAAARARVRDLEAGTRRSELAAAEVADAAATAAYRRALTELARARGTLLRDRAVDWRTTP